MSLALLITTSTVGVFLAVVLSAFDCLAEPRVLVLTKTAGFRHDSIDTGIELMNELGAAHGFGVGATEDASALDAETLALYRAVVFLNTTGDVLDEAQQQALEDFVRGGGGWVGIHSAADTEYDWPFYGELLAGAWFASHPAIQTARLEVDGELASHPCCAQWAPSTLFQDEWYNFRDNPRDAGARVLLRLDESSYDPGGDAMGEDHPIAWQRRVDRGRAWYAGLGHRNETYADAGFRQHLLAGLRWVALLPPGDCDDDGEVTNEERRVGAEIALARTPLDACAAFDASRDRAVTIEELVESSSR